MLMISWLVASEAKAGTDFIYTLGARPPRTYVIAKSMSPEECTLDEGCICYTEKDVEKIDAAVRDLKKCRVDISAKDVYIAQTAGTDDSKTDIKKQAPSSVDGAYSFLITALISFALGSAIGYAVKKSR